MKDKYTRRCSFFVIEPSNTLFYEIGKQFFFVFIFIIGCIAELSSQPPADPIPGLSNGSYDVALENHYGARDKDSVYNFKANTKKDDYNLEITYKGRIKKFVYWNSDSPRRQNLRIDYGGGNLEDYDYSRKNSIMLPSGKTCLIFERSGMFGKPNILQRKLKLVKK